MQKLHFGPIMRAITETIKDSGKAINDQEIVDKILAWAKNQKTNSKDGLSRNSFYLSMRDDDLSTRWIKAFFEVYKVSPAKWFSRYWYYGTNPRKAIDARNMKEALGYNPEKHELERENRDLKAQIRDLQVELLAFTQAQKSPKRPK